ncbi:MAG: QueT transporter family protein [Bacillota bacterium]
MTLQRSTELKGVRYLAKVAVIASLYALFTVLPPFNSLSYGPVQVRISEALTVLPYLTGAAVPGLVLGCLLGNLGSPFLVWDLTVGVGATALAAFLTRRVSKVWLAPLPPVVVNSLLVSTYVSTLTQTPYILTACYIGLGEVVSCYLVGLPLLISIRRNRRLVDLLREG